MPIRLKNTPPYYYFESGVALPISIIESSVNPLTSTGGDTPITKTIVIPANTLKKAGDKLKVGFTLTTTGADTKTMNLTIGSSGTLVASPSLTTAADYKIDVELTRNTSGSYEKRAENWRALAMQGASNAGGTDIDWTVENNLVLTITSTTASSIVVKTLQVKSELVL